MECRFEIWKWNWTGDMDLGDSYLWVVENKGISKLLFIKLRECGKRNNFRRFYI